MRAIPKTHFIDFGTLYENDKGKYLVLNDVRVADILLAALVYVSTYCVPIALLRQNKPFPLLYNLFGTRPDNNVLLNKSKPLVNRMKRKEVEIENVKMCKVLLTLG